AVLAVDRQAQHAGRQAGGVNEVIARPGVDRQPVLGRLGSEDRHPGRQAADRDPGGAAADRHVVRAGGAVDGHGVRRAVATPGAPNRFRDTWATPVPLRSPTVIVSTPPLAKKAISSVLLRSIVMVPTSRVKRTRPPLAVMSIFSL